MRIFVEVPCEGRHAAVGLLTTAIFSVFTGYFFSNFRNEASVII